MRCIQRKFSGRRVAAAVFVALFLALPAALFGQNFRATVQSFSGNVEVQLPGGRWQPAQVGMELPVASQISTSFGAEAVLALGDPAIIRVRPLTRMRIDELVEREGSVESEMFLQVGRVRGEVRGVQGLQSEFRLRSTQATAAVRGTDFDFDGVNLRVLTGLVQVSNRFGRRVSVGGNEETSVSGNEPPSDPLNERTEATVVSSTTAGSGEGSDTSTGISGSGVEFQDLIINVTF